MATIMLSEYFWGISEQVSVAFVIFLLKISHKKWAASFALAININKTNLKFISRIMWLFGLN